MNRIINPLKIMGAQFDNISGNLPLKIIGRNLKNSEIIIDIPSAQIKSGILLAAINTEGKSKIIEKNITRDHTENMLRLFGAEINLEKNGTETLINIVGKKEI